MILSGSTSFPSTQQTPVFTSKYDNAFGEPVAAGTLATSAYRAMYLYNSATVQNIRLRWCRTGIEFNFTGNYLMKDSLIENCDNGVFNNTSSPGLLTLNNVQKCSVTAPYYNNVTPNFGSMTDAPFCLNNAFGGLQKDTSLFPEPPLGPAPDTMGAVGPNHFVEVVNNQIAVFHKSNGGLLSSNETNPFFTGTTHATADPRLIYDEIYGRWIACMIDRVQNDVILAVSYGTDTDPQPLDTTSTGWKLLPLNVTETGYTVDFPTLGFDKNGIYVAVNLYDSLGSPTS